MQVNLHSYSINEFELVHLLYYLFRDAMWPFAMFNWSDGTCSGSWCLLWMKIAFWAKCNGDLCSWNEQREKNFSPPFLLCLVPGDSFDFATRAQEGGDETSKREREREREREVKEQERAGKLCAQWTLTEANKSLPLLSSHSCPIQLLKHPGCEFTS